MRLNPHSKTNNHNNTIYEATSRRSLCTCSYNTFIYDDDYVLMIVMMMKMMMMTMLMMMMMLMLLNWAGLSAGLLGWLGRFGSLCMKILIKNVMIQEGGPQERNEMKRARKTPPKTEENTNTQNPQTALAGGKGQIRQI